MIESIIWSGSKRQIGGQRKKIRVQPLAQSFDVGVVWMAQPSAQRADLLEFVKRIFHETFEYRIDLARKRTAVEPPW